MTRDFEKMYTSLSKYENDIHEHNQKRIRIGIKCIIIIPLIFLTLMFLTNSSKVVFLILWIVSLFALAIYLILVEYADYKLQEKLREICGETDKKIKPLIPEVTNVEMKLVETIKSLDLIDITSDDSNENKDENGNVESDDEKKEREFAELLHHIKGQELLKQAFKEKLEANKAELHKNDASVEAASTEVKDEKAPVAVVAKEVSEEKNSEEHNKDIPR